MNILFILLVAAALVYVYQTYFAGRNYETKDERFNAERHRKQEELDRLLDKISTGGIDSLSAEERRRLDQLSGKNNF